MERDAYGDPLEMDKVPASAITSMSHKKVDHAVHEKLSKDATMKALNYDIHRDQLSRIAGVNNRQLGSKLLNALRKKSC